MASRSNTLIAVCLYLASAQSNKIPLKGDGTTQTFTISDAVTVVEFTNPTGSPMQVNQITATAAQGGLWGEYCAFRNVFAIEQATMGVGEVACAPKPVAGNAYPPLQWGASGSRLRSNETLKSCASDSLCVNEQLRSNEQLTSSSSNARLVLQGDGNLVLYHGSDALWYTGTEGHPSAQLYFQGDGDLVLYDGAVAATNVLWSSGTPSGASRMTIQDDCNLVVHDAAGRDLWNTGTQCKAPTPTPTPTPPPTPTPTPPPTPTPTPSGRTGLVVQPGDSIFVQGYVNTGPDSKNYDVTFGITSQPQTNGVFAARAPRADEGHWCNGEPQSTTANAWSNTGSTSMYTSGAYVYVNSAFAVDAACVYILRVDGSTKWSKCSGLNARGVATWPTQTIAPGEQLLGQASHNCASGGIWDWAAYMFYWGGDGSEFLL